jgi:DUF1009 family protein
VNALSVMPAGNACFPLGILAGGGPFPGQVAAAARSAGREVFILGFEDYAEPAIIGANPQA